MPSVFIIANNRTGKFLGEDLLNLIQPGDWVVGLNRIVWYQDDYPINFWFSRYTSGYYIGFDNKNKPMHPQIMDKLKRVVFIRKDDKVIKKLVKTNKIRRHIVLGGLSKIRDKYKLRKKPSTGFTTMHYFLTHYPDRQIVLVNFTFTVPKCHAHDWANERKVCKKLVKQGKLIIRA